MLLAPCLAAKTPDVVLVGRSAFLLEWQRHQAQVLAGLDQHQRAFVQHDHGRTLAWDVHRLGLGCNGRLHGGDLGGVGVHPLQTAGGCQGLKFGHGQLVGLQLGHAGSRCFNHCLGSRLNDGLRNRLSDGLCSRLCCHGCDLGHFGCRRADRCCHWSRSFLGHGRHCHRCCCDRCCRHRCYGFRSFLRSCINGWSRNCIKVAAARALLLHRGFSHAVRCGLSWRILVLLGSKTQGLGVLAFTRCALATFAAVAAVAVAGAALAWFAGLFALGLAVLCLLVACVAYLAFAHHGLGQRLGFCIAGLAFATAFAAALGTFTTFTALATIALVARLAWFTRFLSLVVELFAGVQCHICDLGLS